MYVLSTGQHGQCSHMPAWHLDRHRRKARLGVGQDDPTRAVRADIIIITFGKQPSRMTTASTSLANVRLKPASANGCPPSSSFRGSRAGTCHVGRWHGV
jgi:hypothetical protein